jgi:hypothetical protein
VFPIIGGRKVEQLRENILALDISLTAEQVERIENATPFNPGFPNSMIVSVYPCMTLVVSDDHQGDGTSDSFILLSAGHIDRVPLLQAITPAKQ